MVNLLTSNIGITESNVALKFFSDMFWFLFWNIYQYLLNLFWFHYYQIDFWNILINISYLTIVGNILYYLAINWWIFYKVFLYIIWEVRQLSSITYKALDFLIELIKLFSKFREFKRNKTSQSVQIENVVRSSKKIQKIKKDSAPLNEKKRRKNKFFNTV